MRLRHRRYRHPRRTNVHIRQRIWRQAIPVWTRLINVGYHPASLHYIHFFVPRRQDKTDNGRAFELLTSPVLSVRYAFTLPQRWGVYILEDAPRYHHMYHEYTEYSIPCPYIYYIIRDQQFNVNQRDTRIMNIVFSLTRVKNFASPVLQCPLPNVHSGSAPCYSAGNRHVYSEGTNLFDRIASELNGWWESRSNNDYADDRWARMPVCVHALGQAHHDDTGGMLRHWSHLSSYNLMKIPWASAGKLTNFIAFQDKHMRPSLVDRPLSGPEALRNHQGEEVAGML